MTRRDVKVIEGRTVRRNPDYTRILPFWDVYGTGRDTGKVIFTGTLKEIRKLLKVN